MKNLDFKFDIRKLKKESQNTSWEKAVFGALLISLVIFLSATLYLFFRPVSTAIKQGVDAELENQNISFNFLLLEKLKSRQTPNAQIQAPSGKNPFVPF